MPEAEQPAGASAGTVADGLEERSSVLLVFLTAMVNFVFFLGLDSARELTAWQQQSAESAGTVMSGGWFWVWPGMPIAWGAAWAGFLIVAVQKRFRRALIVFLLTVAVWLLPIILFVAL